MAITSYERGFGSVEQAYPLTPEEIAKANQVWDKLIKIAWPELTRLPLNREGRPYGAILLHKSLDLVILPGREIQRLVNDSPETMEFVDSATLEDVNITAVPTENGELLPVMTGNVPIDYSDDVVAYAFNPFDEHRFGVRYNGRPRTQPWEFSEISVDAQRYAKDKFVSLILW